MLSLLCKNKGKNKRKIIAMFESIRPAKNNGEFQFFEKRINENVSNFRN